MKITLTTVFVMWVINCIGQAHFIFVGAKDIMIEGQEQIILDYEEELTIYKENGWDTDKLESRLNGWKENYSHFNKVYSEVVNDSQIQNTLNNTAFYMSEIVVKTFFGLKINNGKKDLNEFQDDLLALKETDSIMIRVGKLELDSYIEDEVTFQIVFLKHEIDSVTYKKDTVYNDIITVKGIRLSEGKYYSPVYNDENEYKISFENTSYVAATDAFGEDFKKVGGIFQAVFIMKDESNPASIVLDQFIIFSNVGRLRY